MRVFKTCISRTRLLPRKTIAINPIALKIWTKLLSGVVYDTIFCGSLVTGKIHITVQYVMPITPPINETPKREFRFGNWDMIIAMQLKIKKHCTEVSGTLSSSDNMYRSCCIDFPPVITRIVQAPPERYITGNIPRSFPSFTPIILFHDNNKNATVSNSIKSKFQKTTNS